MEHANKEVFMQPYGLRKGDRYVVEVRLNRVLIATFTGHTISDDETSCSIFVNSPQETVATNEILKAADSALDYYMERPRLRRMLNARIAELKAMEEEAALNEEGDLDDRDIPF
jgi:hypothetical protein